jgi:hypothetical protein
MRGGGTHVGYKKCSQMMVSVVYSLRLDPFYGAPDLLVKGQVLRAEFL